MHWPTATMVEYTGLLSLWQHTLACCHYSSILVYCHYGSILTCCYSVSIHLHRHPLKQNNQCMFQWLQPRNLEASPGVRWKTHLVAVWAFSENHVEAGFARWQTSQPLERKGSTFGWPLDNNLLSIPNDALIRKDAELFWLSGYLVIFILKEMQASNAQIWRGQTH